MNRSDPSDRSNRPHSIRNHRFGSFDNLISPMNQDGPIQLSFVPPMSRPSYYRQRSRESHHDTFNNRAPLEDPNDRIEVFSDFSDSPPATFDGYHSEIESFGDQDEAVNEPPPPVDRNQSFDFDAPLFTPNSQYQPESHVFGTPSPPYAPRTPGWALSQNTPEAMLDSGAEADTIPYDPNEPPTQAPVQQQPQEHLHMRRDLSQNFVDDNSQIVLTQPSQPQQSSTTAREQNTQVSLDLPDSQQTNKVTTQSTLDKYLSQNLSQTVEELFEGLSQGSALSACKSTQELSSQPPSVQSQNGSLMDYHRVVKNSYPTSSQDASQHGKSIQEGKSSQPWLMGTQDKDSPIDTATTSQSKTRVEDLSQPSSSGSSKENKNRTQCEQSIQTFIEKTDQSIQCSSQPWSTLQTDARKQSQKVSQSRKHTKTPQGSSQSLRSTNTKQSSLSDYYQSQTGDEQTEQQQSNDEGSASSSSSGRSSSQSINKSTPKLRRRLGVGLSKPAKSDETSLAALLAKRNGGNRRKPTFGIVNPHRHQA